MDITLNGNKPWANSIPAASGHGWTASGPWGRALNTYRVSTLGPKGRAPKGLEDSAQGFNPGNRRPERFALKGRRSNVLTTRK